MSVTTGPSGALALWDATPLQERPDLFVWLHERELLAELWQLAAAELGSPYGLWRDDPVGFVGTVLRETLTRVQAGILESVRDNERTAVPACFASGKTHILARAVAWFAMVHPLGTATVVTTASRMRQVVTQLWPHLRRLVNDHGLPGDPQVAQWMVPRADGLLERVAYGFTPPGHDPEAVQGIHSPHVLVAIDEGGLISQKTGKAWQSATTGLHSRLIVCGNPPVDTEDSWLEQITTSPHWHTIRIRAADTPNFSGEPSPRCRSCADWQQREHPVSDHLIQRADEELWRAEYGAADPFYRSKVLAEFTRGAALKIVPYSWVELALIRQGLDGPDRTVVEARGPLPRRDRRYPVPFIRLGVDLAQGGADETVIARREGTLLRIVHTQRGDPNRNNVEVGGVILEQIRAAQKLRAELDLTGPEFPLDVVIDSTGAGWGLDGTLRAWQDEGRLGEDVRLVFVNFSQRAEDPTRFLNRKAELWWGLRDGLEPRDDQDALLVLDVDKKTRGQIADPLRQTSSGGLIKVEGKEEMTARGRPSPDRAEALALACYAPPSLMPRRRRGIIAG